MGITCYGLHHYGRAAPTVAGELLLCRMVRPNSAMGMEKPYLSLRVNPGACMLPPPAGAFNTFPPDLPRQWRTSRALSAPRDPRDRHSRLRGRAPKTRAHRQRRRGSNSGMRKASSKNSRAACANRPGRRRRQSCAAPRRVSPSRRGRRAQGGPRRLPLRPSRQTVNCPASRISLT